MLAAFQQAVDAAFAAYGEPATYTSVGGQAINCQAILRRPDAAFDSGGGGVDLTKRTADVRVSEVASAEEDDAITVDGTTFTVRRAYHPDNRRLVWRLELA